MIRYNLLFMIFQYQTQLRKMASQLELEQKSAQAVKAELETERVRREQALKAGEVLWRGWCGTLKR